MENTTSPKYPDVTVDLVGQDGNAFVIIGLVQRAIKKAHGHEAANAFTQEAMLSESYDKLLQLCMTTVNVQ